jgi:methionyl-tRNA formyltransferase
VKQDYVIDWNCGALQIHRRVMALHPGAITSWKGRRLKLLATEPLVRRLAERLSPEAAALASRWGVRESSAGRTIWFEVDINGG